MFKNVYAARMATGSAVDRQRVLWSTITKDNDWHFVYYTFSSHVCIYVSQLDKN
jgi:hypothetical protein